MRKAIVINESGFKVAFVFVDNSDNPVNYKLKETEILIFENVEETFTMVKPKWENDGWVETATPQEIESANPKVDIPKSEVETLKEKLIASQMELDAVKRSVDGIITDIIPTFLESGLI